MTVKDIYDNLQDGKVYGKTMKAVNPNLYETIFITSLSTSEDGQYIRWNHFGSSANKNTVSELEWILKVIFEMTAEEFTNNFEMRKKGQ